MQVKTNTMPLKFLAPSACPFPALGIFGAARKAELCLLSPFPFSPESSDHSLGSSGPWGQRGSQPAQRWAAGRVSMLLPYSPRSSLGSQNSCWVQLSPPAQPHKGDKAVPVKGCVSLSVEVYSGSLRHPLPRALREGSGTSPDRLDNIAESAMPGLQGGSSES